jgi:hypothetical protein
MVTKDTLLKTLLESYPRSYGVFLQWGIPVSLLEVTQVETVGNYVTPQKEQAVLDALNLEVRRQTPDPDQLIGLRDKLIQPGKVNMAGFADFTWHNGFIEEMDAFAERENINLNLCFFNKPDKKAFQHYLHECTDAVDLPDILVGKGFSSLMTRRFVDRFVRTGCFDTPLDVPLHPIWKSMGLYDVKEQYHAFGAEEQVVLRDNTLRPDLPNPVAWSDFLLPIYDQSVTLMGKPQHDHFSFNTMFYLWQQYGADGIRLFSTKVAYKWHFSKIIKDIGKSHPEASPFNVVHRFASHFVRSDANAHVLSFSDGNPVMTFFCLVKKNSSEDVLKTAGHLFSRAVSKLIEAAGAVSAHPESDVASNASLRWIGWEGIQQSNLPYLKDELSAIAYNHYPNPTR